MKYFAVILRKTGKPGSEELREAHINFLEEQRQAGYIIMNGRFIGDEGGLAIYKCNKVEEAETIARQDPYVKSGVRNIEVFEWELQLNKEL